VFLQDAVLHLQGDKIPLTPFKGARFLLLQGRSDGSPAGFTREKDSPMAIAEEYVKFLPLLSQIPQQRMWLSYDAGADVLYVQFQPSHNADDSELTDDDVIIRYEGETVVGYAILNASKRV
jgi:uncharacterized protein YuzE